MTDLPSFRAVRIVNYTPESYIADCAECGDEPNLKEWRGICEEWAYEDMAGMPFDLEEVND